MNIEQQLSNPLESYEDQDLIDELRKRHTAVLVLLLDHKHSHEHECGVEDMKTAFYGGRYTCIGMASTFIDAAHSGYEIEGDD